MKLLDDSAVSAPEGGDTSGDLASNGGGDAAANGSATAGGGTSITAGVPAADLQTLLCGYNQLKTINLATLAAAHIDGEDDDAADTENISDENLNLLLDVVFIDTNLGTLNDLQQSSDPAVLSSSDTQDTLAAFAASLPAFRKSSNCESTGTCGCAAP